MFDYKNLPDYPDRYSRDKNWVRVLPIHGRPIQSAELIEMQSLLHDNLKQGLDTLFTNGSIISGLQTAIVNSSTLDNTVTVSISGGTMYIEGFVVKVEQDSITLPNTGTFTIGVLVSEEIITEVEDPSLRDPIKGSSIIGLEGAARLVWNTSLVVDNANSFTIAKLIDGNLVKVNNSSVTSFERLLSQYTYDRNGNFCVRGLEISQIRNDTVIVSDRTKYRQISDNLDNARNSAQQALTDALAAKATLDSLRARLVQAQSEANISPTTNNNLVVQGLINSIVDAQNTYNTLSSLVVARQEILTKANAAFNISKDLLVDKVTLLVNPGVAYVQGKRIDLANPSILSIPKDLGTQEVDTAVFVYSGSKASSIRVLSGDLNAAIANNRILTITFDKIKYQGQSKNVEVRIELAKTGAANISALLDYITAQFNSNTTADDGITFTSTQLNLDSASIRAVIKENCTVRKNNLESLIFESTAISSQANQIEVIIAGNAISTNNLAVNIASASLGGAAVSTAFQLGFRPVNEVISLTAELEENLTPIIRGSAPGTADVLGDDTIIEITKVVQGSTTFVQGRDYILTNQSRIDWSPSTSTSTEPAPGSTYYVSFVYTQPLVQNTDFILNREGDIIEFTGRAPGVNKRFYVDYSYFLSKAGVITLSADGSLSYILGSDSPTPIPPKVPDSILSLAYIDIYADRTVIKPIECKAVSFSNIRSLIEEVRQNSRMISSLSLENEIYELGIAATSSVIGLTADTLTDLSNTDIDSTAFTAAIIPTSSAITMGYSYKDVDLRLNLTSNVIVHNNNLGNESIAKSIATLNYTEVPLISQNRSSRAIDINTTTPNGRGSISISPNLLFRNTKVSKFNPCDPLIKKSSLLSRLAAPLNSVLGSISRSSITSLRIAAEAVITSLRTGCVSIPSDSLEDSYINYVADLVKSATAPIYLKVENLPPNTSRYGVYLSGRQIKTLLPYNGTSIETINNTSYASVNSDGTMWIRFNVPANLEPGTHVIEVKGPSGFSRTKLSIYNNLLNHILVGASYNWDSNPTNIVSDNLINIEDIDISDQPIIQSTSTLLSPGVLPSITISATADSQKFPYLFDKISQSFELPDYYFITSVNLKFKNLPTLPIKLYLREVDEFGPAKMAISASNTSTLSTNSTLPNNWSTFKLQYPTPLQPSTYCFGLKSNSAYSLYSALIGEEDLITKSLQGDQLYLRGDLYKSQNGYAIEAFKEEDLTYKLNVASFSLAEGIVNFGSYGSTYTTLDGTVRSDAFFNITAFTLNTKIISPKGTSLKYEYSLNQNTWVEFIPNLIVCFNQVVSNFYLRAVLKTSDPKVSPIVYIRDASVSMYSSLSSSYYLSEIAEFDEGYKNINIYFKYIKSSNITINVYYSPAIESEESLYISPWRRLNFMSESPVDLGLDLYRSYFNIVEPTVLDQLTGGNQRARVRFRYKIEMINQSALTNSSAPFIFDLTSYVY